MKLNIKDKLEAKNMSRYELAKRIGVTYPTITAIYNGDSTSIKLDILEALCRELDCTPNEIVVSEVEDVTNRIEMEKLIANMFLKMATLYKVIPCNNNIELRLPDNTIYTKPELDDLFNNMLKRYNEIMQKSETGEEDTK